MRTIKLSLVVAFIANALFLTAQNVGIGVEHPGSKLSVAGGISIGETYAGKNAPDGTILIEKSMGIGTDTIDPNVVLDIRSTTKGVLFPTMNTQKRNSIINPPKGLFVFNEDSSGFNFYNGASWLNFALLGPTGPIGAAASLLGLGANNSVGGYAATSVSLSTVSTGTKVLVTQLGLSYRANDRVRISAASNKYMEGVVTTYLAGVLTVNVDRVVGSGSSLTWAIGLAGDVGATGPAGAAGAQGAQGIQGVAGAAGAQGIQGLKGATGATGANGTNGTNGAAGAVGPQGPAGAVGAVGPQGAAGTNGINGSTWYSGTGAPANGTGALNDFYLDASNGTYYKKGASTWASQGSLRGVTGAAGANGTNGAAGAQGPQGIAGPTGANGTNGAAGAVGPQGPAGVAGAAGAQGPQGIQGVAGPAGAAGAQGLKGNTGATGATGANGTNGTNGAAGTVGPQGPAGAVGAQGPQGIAGPTGAAGANGTNGAVGPQGPAGVAGAAGAQGPQGIAGPTGAAGANGTNGAVGPQGPAGVAGAAGAQGPQGIQGVAGPAGAAGAQGLKGNTGATGATGANGTNGTNGTNGAAGAVGPQGPAGVAGAVGAQGPAGAVGPAGAAGAQGIQGLKGNTGATGATGANGTNGTNGAAGAVGPQGPAGVAGSNGTVWHNGAGVPASGTGANGDFYLASNGSYYKKAAGAWGSSLGSLKGATGAAGAAGTNGTNGTNGVLSAGSAAGNTPYWNGSSWIINNSNIFNNGGNVGIGTTSPGHKFEVMNGNLSIDNTNNNAGSLVMYEPSNSGTNFTAFKARAQAGDITYNLPASQSANSLLVNDGSGNLNWSPLNTLVATMFEKKNANESISNNTLQDDNDFTYTLEANQSYEVSGLIRIGAHADGEWQFKFVAPAQTQTLISMAYNTEYLDEMMYVTSPGTTYYMLNDGANQNTDVVFVNGMVTTGNQGGTFKFQWAQRYTNATATTIYANSYLRLTRAQ